MSRSFITQLSTLERCSDEMDAGTPHDDNTPKRPEAVGNAPARTWLKSRMLTYNMYGTQTKARDSVNQKHNSSLTQSTKSPVDNWKAYWNRMGMEKR
jgi:hypothetical protein